MIQNEIEMDEDGEIRLLEGGDVVVVDEPPVLGKATSKGLGYNDDEEDSDDAEDEKEEKTSSIDGDSKKDSVKLSTAEGSFTRCELTIQRVETHLLDPSPLGLSALSRASSFGEGVDGALAATSLQKLSKLDLSSHKEESKSCIEKENLPNANPTSLDEKINDSDNPISLEETLSSRNIRVAVVGNVDAGKSTLIGTLVSSFLDDGRGSSRTSIMKHRHEIESGRTSTATSHLLGFRHSGEPISGRDKVRANRMKSEDEIARESYRIITLMDLAGHEKYLKTTIHGVSSGMADYGLILVNSRHPPTHMTQHHLNLCCSFGIPVIVVFTKVDGCPDHALATSKSELTKVSVACCRATLLSITLVPNLCTFYLNSY